MNNAIKKFHSPVRTIYFLLLTVLSSFFYSCSDDIDTGLKDPGILSLTLASDTTFGNIVTTKAQILEELIPFQYIKNYTVEILQGNNIVHSYDKFEDMPDEIELSAGAYTMKAYKGENKPAAFNSPYFEGTVDFVIEKGMRTPISDTCTLANTRVAVTYTDDFLDAYEEFRIRMNTEHMGTDTIRFKEDEIRGAYFKTDATGTELNMNLWLVKREDSVINYYKPSPLTIYPRENVILLFKTDSAALNGIGLQVTINRAFDKDTTLNMTIPEYAWGDVKEPTLDPTYFPSLIDETTEGKKVTYFALQNGDYSASLGYVIPGSVGKCMVSITKTENGSTNTIDYDLAKASDAAAAKELGIIITSQDNSTIYNVATETKNGHIHFTDAFTKLPASKEEVEYAYTVYIIDAVPTNPNSTDTVQMVVKPNRVGPSSLENVNNTVKDYIIPATESLPNNVEVKFDTDAGIQSATLTIERNSVQIGEYNITSSLPQGISYVNGLLIFDKGFVNHLEVEPGVNEEYKFTIVATDNLDRDFVNNEMSFSVIKTPVFEIVVPTEQIWGWKAQIGVVVSGLTEANKSNLKLYISEDGNNYSELQNWNIEGIFASEIKTGLHEQTPYYVKAKYGQDETPVYLFSTEGENISNGDMEAWVVTNKACRYRAGALNYPTVNVPYPSLTGWNTNNDQTATNTTSYSTGSNDPYAALACFPTVVYEIENSNKYAAIRSIDATTPVNGSKNNKARGELSYEGDFTSRPSSITFDYSYQSHDNSGEKSVVEIYVYSASGTIIGSAQLFGNEETNFSTYTLPIQYLVTDQKAAKIKILFASSDSLAPQTSTAQLNAYNYQGALISYTSVNYGSTLKIDNVVLNYTGQ